VVQKKGAGHIMATFVLVHGAWHGGWCWKKVVPLLHNAGHEVFTPTLTGLGERAHLLTPDIDLRTNENDILGVLEYEDLQDVLLVGHSYGGMVISSVAEQAGARLAHLVYLDAFLPENGKALRDYIDGPATDELVQVHGDGWRFPKPEMVGEDFFGVTDPADLDWMLTRVGDHPYKTMTQPVQLTDDRLNSLPRTFILTTVAPLFREAAERAQRLGFRYYELLSAGHNAMVTQPAELVKILLELV
jgi:pimeloyl-ACP methyl ester carboxylesterase